MTSDYGIELVDNHILQVNRRKHREQQLRREEWLRAGIELDTQLVQNVITLLVHDMKAPNLTVEHVGRLLEDILDIPLVVGAQKIAEIINYVQSMTTEEIVAGREKIQALKVSGLGYEREHDYGEELATSNDPKLQHLREHREEWLKNVTFSNALTVHRVVMLLVHDMKVTNPTAEYVESLLRDILDIEIVFGTERIAEVIIKVRSLTPEELALREMSDDLDLVSIFG